MAVKRWEDFTHAGSPLRRKITYDPDAKKIYTKTWQPNINEVLENNQRMANEHTDGPYNRNGLDGWTMVASIPMWLLEKWRVEEGIDFYRWNEEDKARIIRKLNDIDYQKLRTSRGKI